MLQRVRDANNDYGHLRGTVLSQKIADARASVIREVVGKVQMFINQWCVDAQSRGNDLKNLKGVKARAKADAGEEIISTLQSLAEQKEGEDEAG